jgi:hypothetical protein
MKRHWSCVDCSTPRAAYCEAVNLRQRINIVTNAAHVIPKIVVTLLSGGEKGWIGGSYWTAVASIVFIASILEDLLSPLSDGVIQWVAATIHSGADVAISTIRPHHFEIRSSTRTFTVRSSCSAHTSNSFHIPAIVLSEAIPHHILGFSGWRASNWGSVDWGTSDWGTANWGSSDWGTDWWTSNWWTDWWTSDWWTSNWWTDWWTSDWWTSNWGTDWWTSPHRGCDWRSSNWSSDWCTSNWSTTWGSVRQHCGGIQITSSG